MSLFRLEALEFSPTAALFEGGRQAGLGFTMFVVRTPPCGLVGLHLHPYSETFLLLEGSGRWTAGDSVVELEANHILVVPPHTRHGFRNTGAVPFQLVSVHESPTLEQTFTGDDPA